MPASSLARAASVAAASMLLALPGSAIGAQKTRALDAAPWVTDGVRAPADAKLTGRSSFGSGNTSIAGQHGPNFSHLPAVRENIDVVGKLEMNTPTQYRFNPDEPGFDPSDPSTGTVDPSQPAVVAGQIADLAVYKNTAYLASWSEASCRRGGFFSVDISNPAQPRQLAFVPARPGTYHGEGTHVVTFNGRDILAVNNEPCGANGVGGFELYDVTNPAAPVHLTNAAQAAGDRSPDDSGDPPTGKSDTTQSQAVANSNHSIFMWSNAGRLYAVTVDNTEIHDVDIFDITNPSAPVFIADLDLVALAERQGFNLIDNGANGNAIFHHDMVVKRIGNVQTLLSSYWDAGYVKLNVNDPANPVFIGDSDFGTTDPLTGMQPPEGNGHQSEFSHDNRFVLAADEDFSTYRLPEFDITTGPHAGQYPAGEFGFTRPMASLDDNTLNGPTFFGGYGCDVSNPIPAAPGTLTLDPGEESIVVLSRGPDGSDPGAPYPACTFQEKAENAAAAGWDAVIIGNHHVGAAGGDDPDAALCGSGDFADIIAVCLGHRGMHNLFDDPPGQPRPEDYDYTAGNEPQVGDEGAEIETTSLFDGWGYTHLYRNTASDLEVVDDFAIEESLDERYAFGFGDLSVHEFATDPTENVAYSSYYAGGMRVFTFGDSGLNQTGKFIDDGGSNFWGVEQFTTSQGDRLFAGSDRDYGLYLFRYTGPGAAQKPVCADQNVTVPFQTATRIALSCTDANGNPLTLAIASGPARGAVSAVDQAAKAVTYTPNSGYTGADSFTFTANDGAATSAPATVRITVGAGPTGCRNLITGTRARDLIAGTAASDGIRSGDGDDVIDAREGSDCLFGQNDADVIDGESGNDQISGGSGGDRLLGGFGADRLSGGAGVDRLNGEQGNDRVVGGAKRDILSGGRGNDTVSGGAAKDTITGGPGLDRLFGGASADRIFGNAGSDRIIPGKGRDRVIAAGGNDRINVRDGNVDRVSCGSGRDRVTADRADVLTSCERVSRR